MRSCPQLFHRGIVPIRLTPRRLKPNHQLAALVPCVGAATDVAGAWHGAAWGKHGRGTAMKSNAFDFREHFDRQLSNLAELKKRHPQQATTNVVDINDRLPLHLDMVVSDFLAQAVDGSRK